MSAGGRRVGAGRPPKLDFWARLKIGSECEERWIAFIKQVVEREQEEQIARVPAMERIQASSREAAEKAAHEERRILREGGTWEDAEAAGRRIRGAWRRSKSHDEELREELVEAGAIGEGADDEAERPVHVFVVSVRPRRPKGLRPSILNEVTTVATARHPEARITSRFVEECWKEHRRLMADSK
jgi:hypothetical protein